MKAAILFIAILPLTSLAGVTSYFNQNQSKQYVEPYRGITRRGDNLEAVILSEINKAKKSVYVAVQELRLPLIAQALINKKKQGVDVRVVLEHDYNFTVERQTDRSSDNEHDASKLTELRAFVDVNRDGKMDQAELSSRDAIYMLNKAQIPVMDDASDGSSGSGLMHHKFVIVDGNSTIVSSANFTMSCIHGDTLTPGSRGNANSLIKVESASFANVFTQEFAQLWGRKFGNGKSYRGPQTVVVAGTKLTVQFSPTSRKSQWHETVNGLIGSTIARAASSVKAALFVYSDQSIANVLERRALAGVSIGMIVEPKFAFRDYSELLDMMGARMLNGNCAYETQNNPWARPVREVGIPKLAGGDVLHHKFAVVDSKIVIMGSENWSDSANYINDETLVVIESSAISDSYTQEYRRVLGTSVLGVPAWLQTEISRKESNCANHGFHY